MIQHLSLLPRYFWPLNYSFLALVIDHIQGSQFVATSTVDVPAAAMPMPQPVLANGMYCDMSY